MRSKWIVDKIWSEFWSKNWLINNRESVQNLSVCKKQTLEKTYIFFWLNVIKLIKSKWIVGKNYWIWGEKKVIINIWINE
jgi:hypothetical protein